ncbi:MAG: nucleoside monophosphate kinase [Verrucomicrobia bacterium]|nr:nucleoside monophosphate kinase [Verrucomicrobiota bacterium]
MKRRIVLLGPPASGKGTQAELIQKRFAIPATSTGAILRREAKHGTALGVAANRIISKGGLAPDDLILQVVAAWLNKIDSSFLFDGFPRTSGQAERFELLLDHRGTALELAILLELSDAVIRERMSRRLTCSSCGKVISVGRHVRDLDDPCPNCEGKLEVREDDTDLVLARLMNEYREKTLPVTDFYHTRGILACVDASREAGLVFNDLSQLITE